MLRDLPGEVTHENLLIKEYSFDYSSADRNKESEQDRTLMALMNESEDFVQLLNDDQLHIYEVVMRNDLPMKYFMHSVKTGQIDELERITKEHAQKVGFNHYIHEV